MNMPNPLNISRQWQSDSPNTLTAVKSRRYPLNRAFSFVLAFWSVIQACEGQAPMIVMQPVSQDVTTGASAILKVQATGTEPFSYQWLKNGAPLQGSNQQSIVFASANPAQTATYSVRVLNQSGSTLSHMARLEIHNLSASVVPIALEGWNADVVLEDSVVPLATADFDTFGAYWFEAGLAGHQDGLPLSRRFTSQFNTNVMFQLQSYEAN